MKKIIICFLLMAYAISSLAQASSAGVIKGKIIDEKDKKPIEYADIVIRNIKTNDVIKGGVTDRDGNFFINSLKNGSYKAVISFIGYKSIEQEFSVSTSAPITNLKEVALSEDSQMLNAVQVVGQRSQMKFDIDKKVFNVDQNIASAGGSASEVLSNIPSVEVDNEGEISLRGSSSVTVWINGRASGLTADNRAQILEQLPAESIDKVEVITNPSARYNPEGTAGIINIVLKQNRKGAYYGSLQAGADILGGYNLNGNINYSSGKLDAYASVGRRLRKMEGTSTIDRTYLDSLGNPSSYLNQNSTNDGGGGPVIFRTGLTYHLTKKDHLSIGALGMLGSRTQDSEINYLTTTIDPASNIKSQRISSSNNTMRSANFELGYKRDFTENSNLDIIASYSIWNRDGESSITQNKFLTSNITKSTYQLQKNDMLTKTFDFQADYVNKFNEKTKIEAGYKGTFSWENTPAEIYSGDSKNSLVFIDDLYNKFLYNQYVQAAYTTFSTRFDKLGIQAGLRGEYSKTEVKSLRFGEDENNITPYEKDYFSLFPSVFLSYQLPADNEIQLNYTRRISRPRGGQLNPFYDLRDSLNISYGNPYLDPQFSNSLELNYIKNWKKHTLSVSAYYRNTDDVIQRISYKETDANGNPFLKSTFDNVAKTQSAGTEFVLKNSLFKVLDFTTTLNLYYNKLSGLSFLPEGATDQVVANGNENFAWNARAIANVRLPYATSLQVTGSYSSKQVTAQGHRNPSYSVDAGIRKSFFDRKLSLAINLRDVLNSQKWETFTNTINYFDSTTFKGSGRVLGFTLTYSFGNSTNTKKQQTRSNDNMMEQMDDF